MSLLPSLEAGGIGSAQETSLDVSSLRPLAERMRPRTLDDMVGQRRLLAPGSALRRAVEAGRVVAAGGQLFKEKFSIGQYGFCALAHDTEGNMFGLHSMQ